MARRKKDIDYTKKIIGISFPASPLSSFHFCFSYILKMDVGTNMKIAHALKRLQALDTRNNGIL